MPIILMRFGMLELGKGRDAMITRLILDRNVSKLVATSVESNLTPACLNVDSIIRDCTGRARIFYARRSSLILQLKNICNF